MDSEIPEYLLDELPIEEIAKSLKFKKNAYGCYEGTVDILNISICDGFPQCTLVIDFSIQSAIGIHDFYIPNNISPIELFLIFYKHWKDARGGDFNDTLLPAELFYGKIHFENKINLEKMAPTAPILWADRAFFRFCINHIDKNIDRNDEDYDIEFSQFENQLRIKAKSTILYCPADGHWLDTMIVSARDFFDFMPKRFMGERLYIRAEPEHIVIGSHQMSAKYIESELEK